MRKRQLSRIPCNLLTLTSRLSHRHNYSAFTPLIFSGIFYASNGRYKISYVDSLFNCVSAMTVTGLATVNLSSLTGFQQALLFMLMCMGNPVSVFGLIYYYCTLLTKKQRLLSHGSSCIRAGTFSMDLLVS